MPKPANSGGQAKRANLTVSPRHWAMLVALASERGISASEKVRNLIDAEWERNPPKKAASGDLAAPDLIPYGEPLAEDANAMLHEPNGREAGGGPAAKRRQGRGADRGSKPNAKLDSRG